MQNLQFAVQRQKRQIYDSKRHDIATQFKLLIRKPLIFFLTELQKFHSL